LMYVLRKFECNAWCRLRLSEERTGGVLPVLSLHLIMLKQWLGQKALTKYSTYLFGRALVNYLWLTSVTFAGPALLTAIATVNPLTLILASLAEVAGRALIDNPATCVCLLLSDFVLVLTSPVAFALTARVGPAWERHDHLVVALLLSFVKSFIFLLWKYLCRLLAAVCT
jgi:hypothetical protein